MEVKIDRDVPVPKSRKKASDKPWCDMKPGESFFIPALSEDGPMTDDDRVRLRKALMHLGHKYFGAGNYSVRAEAHEGTTGFRVWRRA